MPTMLERDDNETEYEVNEWMRFGLRLGVSTALHPFEYAKVLMQVSCKTFPVLLAGIDRGFFFLSRLASNRLPPCRDGPCSGIRP